MVSMKVTVMMATLAALCVLATNTHAALYGSCCRRYIPVKPKFSDIQGFSVQKRTELCNISAIIFHTKKGKRCADPALGWVLDYVSRIEYEAQKVHQKAQVGKK
ncbi:C-C motif chemokine 20a.3 [Gambusia affinis]|uniref:C-C motif chemokine 20a.3 n=1 Tax=Gambusia affinis TaxID=33528 RepID=UPI001CDC6587|nr:C-C motif chemokine 20a.3 [Gambusia affinis]